ASDSGLVLFFFSSRRRHTRFSRDWSSDVCSSDLVTSPNVEPGAQQMTEDEMRAAVEEAHRAGRKATAHAQGTEGIKAAVRAGRRSEERRVGKECRCRGGTDS